MSFDPGLRATWGSVPVVSSYSFNPSGDALPACDACPLRRSAHLVHIEAEGPFPHLD